MQKTWIPSYGNCDAVPVEDLEAGMVTIWAGGCKKEIAGVGPSRSGKTFQIQYADGHLDRRMMKDGRLIAID